LLRFGAEREREREGEGEEEKYIRKNISGKEAAA
jgi:hypothetical protein